MAIINFRWVDDVFKQPTLLQDVWKFAKIKIKKSQYDSKFFENQYQYHFSPLRMTKIQIGVIRVDEVEITRYDKSEPIDCSAYHIDSDSTNNR